MPMGALDELRKLVRGGPRWNEVSRSFRYPSAADQRGFGEGRGAALVVMDHLDHHAHGGFSDDVVMLMHASPVGMVLSPLQLNETDILRDTKAEGSNPPGHDMIEGKNHIRFFFLQPAPKCFGFSFDLVA